MKATRTEERARQVTEVPLLRFLGARLRFSEGALVLPWSAQVENAAGALHGGVISSVLDLAAYLATLPHLRDDEEAVTHALNISYLAAAPPGAGLRADGALLRRGRRIAFARGELRADGQLVAVGNVTKSIVPADREEK